MKNSNSGLLALMVLMVSMQFILALLTYMIIRLMGKDLNIYMEVVNGRWSMSLLWLAVYYSLLFLVSTLALEALTIILPLGKLPLNILDKKPFLSSMLSISL